MPDYSACNNDKCHKKNKCARYLMVWGQYQTVGSFDDIDCEFFWDAEKGVPFKLRDLPEQT